MRSALSPEELALLLASSTGTRLYVEDRATREIEYLLAMLTPEQRSQFLEWREQQTWRFQEFGA